MVKQRSTQREINGVKRIHELNVSSFKFYARIMQQSGGAVKLTMHDPVSVQAQTI